MASPSLKELPSSLPPPHPFLLCSEANTQNAHPAGQEFSHTTFIVFHEDREPHPIGSVRARSPMTEKRPRPREQECSEPRAVFPSPARADAPLPRRDPVQDRGVFCSSA